MAKDELARDILLELLRALDEALKEKDYQSFRRKLTTKIGAAYAQFIIRAQGGE